MAERLLIAGMGGVIGRHVARVGVEQDFMVFGTIHNHIPPELDSLSNQGKLTILKADLRQEEQAIRVLSLAKPDVIVNLAGYTKSDPVLGRRVLDENMAILKNLVLGALCPAKGKEKFHEPITFVQIGTIWEYGQEFGEAPLKEVPYYQLPYPADSNFYAQSKIAAEDLLLTLFQTGFGVNPIFLRLAHHTGEGQWSGLMTVGADAVLRVKEGMEDVIYVKNKLGRIDLSYAEDGARAINLLAHCGISGEAYNIARGSEVSVEDILRTMAWQLGLSPVVQIASTGEEYETYARFNVQKLLSTGYKPCFSIDETVKRFLHWYCQSNVSTINQSHYQKRGAVA